MLKWWQYGEYSEIAYFDMVKFWNGAKILILLK